MCEGIDKNKNNVKEFKENKKLLNSKEFTSDGKNEIIEKKEEVDYSVKKTNSNKSRAKLIINKEE